MRFYALAQEAGLTEFMAAVELAAEQAAVGVDYVRACLLYTSDAADERSSVDLGGRRLLQKKKKKHRRRIDTQK